MMRSIALAPAGDRGRTRSPPPAHRLAQALCLCLLVWAAPARSATWIEQAQSDLLCSGLADDAERQGLAAPLLPAPIDAKSVTAYFRGPPRDQRHARFRHLTALAAIGWWADQVNDQALRNDVYLNVGVLADRYAGETGEAAFRQAARCARAHLIDANLELERFPAVDRFANDLAKLYAAQPPENPIEDWPLLFALRSVSVEPRSRTAISVLATRAVTSAGPSLRANQAERSSRLLATSSRAFLTLGDSAKAQQLALQSLTVSGKPPAQDAAWRAMPVLYDATLARNGAAEAARLQAMLRPDEPPAGLNDNQAAFESMLRLSMAAETQERYDDMSRLAGKSFAILGRMRGLERFPMPFYRHALDELATTRSKDFGTLARADAAFGAKTLATYMGMYDTLLGQAQNQFVGDAREQAFFQYKIDNNLHAQTELYPALPRSQADIADSTFRLAQLRSFGRLTLATLSAEIDRAGIDPASHGQVERFFMMTTQSSDFLRDRFESIRIAPGGAPPDGEALWKVFFPLDVYHEETAKQYDKYVAFVRQKAPGVTELATPRPLPVREFQRRLQGHEAVVATLVTPLDLYVWAITASGVTLTRHAITEREIGDKVQRLRAGLRPAASGLPAFDAAVAYELYRLIFEPSAPALKGVTNVVWYGHGPLGAVPPAVLVTAAPPKAQLRTPQEFAATRFLVDRHAFAALADLSLFAWHRDRPAGGKSDIRFLGVGAPMLTTEELVGAPRSRSYELAGSGEVGLTLDELQQLPRLAESVDEIRALADVMGEANSTLWLGPEASERHFEGARLKDYRTMVLATHGFLPGELANVPEPAVMLALEPESRDRFDGILTSREIAGLTLDADLVILSACNTASADGRPRAETFTGLTQAFFTAGTRSLMVSHWPVMSGAAVQLSVGTVERSKGKGVALATGLQQAMQAIRKDGAASAIESHPSYWGPFVIVGDGR